MADDFRIDFLTVNNRFPNFDMESYLNDKQVEFRKVESGDHDEWTLDCPECHNRGEPTPDIHKKLWVNLQKGKFHCYRCKWSGPLTRLIEKLSNVPFVEAIKVLRGEQLDPLDHLSLKLYEERFEFDEEEDEIKEIELPYGYEPIEGPHPYLQKRGIPWKHAANQDWGISTAGYTKDRIIVPTFMDDRLVYWQARATWDEPGNKEFKKVLNPKGVSARSILYNYDVAKQYEEIVIVEGFIDAVKAGPNAVATNGKRLHPEQVEWLRKTQAKKIILAWDLDAWTDSKKTKDGQLARKRDGSLIKPCSMKQATDLLRVYFDVKCVKMPEGRDPGSYPYKSEEFKRILKSAKRPKFS
jgi:hypothetical protein